MRMESNKAVIIPTHSASTCLKPTDLHHSLTLFTHLSIKFFFRLVCVVASKGVGKESWVCISSASKMPSQLRHLRELGSISLVSKWSLLSDSRSGRLYSDFSGDADLELLLLLVNCSQLCEVAGEARLRDDWRWRRGL